MKSLGIASICCLGLPGLAAAFQAEASGPADRGLVSVVIRFGLQDEQPSTWEGSYELTRGRVAATDGWRFAGGDYATPAKFRLETRRFYPRFWNRRGRDPSTLPIEPNGVILTLAELGDSSRLDVRTSRGDFQLDLGRLKYGMLQELLGGQVNCERLPSSRALVQRPTEDGYPSAAVLPSGRLGVAYVAFEHGTGFQSRLPISQRLADFAYLAKPTGGDRLMFLETDGEQASEPVDLSEAGDLLGPTTAVDGQGRLWVFWSANQDGNWDLLARWRQNNEWSEPIRITTAAGSDFNQVAATDSAGRVWLAWQTLSAGNADIHVVRQEADGFHAAEVVAKGPANEWSPAIAASSDGRVSVVWDSYAKGDYDILARTWTAGRWSAERVVAGSLENEARPSAVYDARDQLWIAYEISPEGWGKDFGPYDQGPRRTALYQERRLGVRVLHGDTLLAPRVDVNGVLPTAVGQRRRPQSADVVRAASPKLVRDSEGRIWLAARMRLDRFDNDLGGAWLTYLTTPDGDGWQPAVMVPESDGFLHETSSLAAPAGGGLVAVSVSDGRFRAAAAFGPLGRKQPPLPLGIAARTTRARPDSTDPVFNRELALADTGPVGKPARDCELEPVSETLPAGPSPEAAKEAEQVAAIRSYRAEVGGRTLQLSRGEFHRHTEFSSDGPGDGSIEDMWRYGLDMAALDWIGNGDHDNGNGREFPWWYTQKTTDVFHIAGVFTPMFTYERSVSYPDGHRNAVFARRGVRPLGRLQGGTGQAMDQLPAETDRPHSPDTLMFYDYLRYFDGVCAGHTSGTDMGTDWRDNDPQVEPIVEIYQGDRQNYERPGAPRTNTAEYSIGGWRPMGFVSNALLKGYRLGFQASSDHISTHMSYCNVWVEEPTREAILEGMKLRRIYGSTDNIIADVRCGEHFMGEEFTVDKPPTLHVKLIGTAPFAEVVIVKDNEYAYTLTPNQQTVEFRWTDMQPVAGKTSYYYVRGTQVGEVRTQQASGPDGRRADVELNNGEIVWVSPMWIRYQP